MNYYIDTCVWIDFVKDRFDVEKIFFDIINQEHTVIVSYPLKKELYKYLTAEETRMIFTLLQSKSLLEEVRLSSQEIQEANHLSRDRLLPFADALHAILARNNDALFITRDKHFLQLTDICQIILL